MMNCELRQLNTFIKSCSTSNAAIKNTASPIPKEGWYPAYSASGQDVWLPEYRYSGKGIVVSAVGARCGKCFQADGKWNVTANTHVLLVDESIADYKYCWYLLNNESWWIKSGSGQPFVKVKDSLNRSILLPDLSTQQHIATILDKISEGIALCRKMMDELELMVKSGFSELFYSQKYPILKWNEVFSTTTGKLDSNAAVVNGKYPFFTCSKEILRIDEYAFDQEALLLAGNNASGKYDVKYYNGKFNAYQRTYVLTLKEKWSYRLFQCQLEEKLEYLQQKSLGGLTKYLTLKILEELSFVIPPKEKQNEFEIFILKINKSKLTIQRIRDKMEMEKLALMQEYFGREV